MNILYIVDRNPFPPRDGVSIPAAGAIKLLSDNHKVHLVVVSDHDQEPLANARLGGEVSPYCCAVTHIRRNRMNWLRGIANELFLGKPLFFSYSYDEDGLSKIQDPFDVIVVSPINVLDCALLVRRNNQPIVAAISDVYTSVLKSRRVNFSSVRELVGSLVQKTRGSWMARLEARWLEKCDIVLVQTERDKRWLGVISNGRLLNRCVIMTNGVSDLLFSSDGDFGTGRDILFVASFGDYHYRAMLKWFVRFVWPEVKRRCKSVRLRVVGSGIECDRELLVLLESDCSICHSGFVENLSDVYRGVRIAIAPIFKSYGFMNKVGEALAAGIPVVGDRSAFNGVEDVVSMGAGFVAESPDEFIEQIAFLFNDEQAWADSSSKAREFARHALRWSQRETVWGDVISRVS